MDLLSLLVATLTAVAFFFSLDKRLSVVEEKQLQYFASQKDRDDKQDSYIKERGDAMQRSLERIENRLEIIQQQNMNRK